MEFVFLVFGMSMLNLVLGFALAVYLRFRWYTVANDWRLLGPARPSGQISNGRDDAIGEPVQAANQQQAVSPSHVPWPAAAENVCAPVPKPERINVDTFGGFVAKFASSLTDFAARLKRSNRGDCHRTAWDFVAELQGICQPYLEKPTQAAEGLSDQLAAEVQELILEQASQLETTLSNLQYMDFDASVTAAMGRLSQESENTLAMTRRLQQAIQAPTGTTGQKASEESPQPVSRENQGTVSVGRAM